MKIFTKGDKILEKNNVELSEQEEVVTDKKNVSKEEKCKKIKKEIIEWTFCIIIAYILYLFLNYFVGSISGVKQASMTPTAIDGDKLIIQRTVMFEKDLENGDIITFIAPDEMPTTDEVTTYTLESDEAVATYYDREGVEAFMFDFLSIGKTSYIKRVIGVAGDHVYIDESGEVYVNDILQDEPYINDGTTSLNGHYTDVIVPEGYIYVMGDNRLNSIDSRFFGCIPINKVDGYVITRVWPLNKLGEL